MTLSADSQPVFAIDGAAPLGLAPSVLSLWSTRRLPHQSAKGGVAFDIGATASAEMLIWRVSLPADLGLAAEHLAAGEAQLAASERALEESELRIATLVESQTRGASFDLGRTDAVLPQPEEELLNTLSDYESDRQPAAFRWGEQFPRGWDQRLQSFQAVMDRLVKFVAYYAWVETEVEGQLVGRTAVSWLGDVNTIWYQPLNAEQAALHERALALALASRDTLLRAFATASRGAILLSTLPTLLATPAGAIVALPAAWKFINQVLSNLDKA